MPGLCGIGRLGASAQSLGGLHRRGRRCLLGRRMRLHARLLRRRDRERRLAPRPVAIKERRQREGRDRSEREGQPQRIDACKQNLEMEGEEEDIPGTQKSRILESEMWNANIG